MTRKRSAGLLLYRGAGPAVEVLLAHMGGPFWAAKDAGAWTVPKGEYDEDETPEAAARREFQEELGVAPPGGEPIPLGSVTQTGGKLVIAWALEGDLDPAGITPGTFTMEWPKGSGRTREFPEIDRVSWFGLEEARRKMVTRQRVFLDRLEELVGGAKGAEDTENDEGAGPGSE
ncbi:DNA mismatch repair protein MutT [Streptomyces antioxidans]|uniref:DNA mismatch repair protein MutT n=1 Tax=Streptomyces antioxidans TaxID=1507734 RepID=A0A1V4D759_9ACTN|nr:NUDIX domain-containing protein [Streptomyces antioxidans]OPF80732.1 DNA mismatch repair protein MutT [Streptomyces antioxidans]